MFVVCDGDSTNEFGVLEAKWFGFNLSGVVPN